MEALRESIRSIVLFSSNSRWTIRVNVPLVAGATVTTAVGYLVARYFWELIPIGGKDQKAVFISGCDSGFGRALSLKCARAGFTVFAGCLTQEGSESLTAEANGLPLQTVPLDVSSDESVKEAREIVGKNLGEKKLWSVVNNAGIFSCYGLAEWTTPDEYKLSFNVNLLGAVRVTNAFLDLLKRSRGRVISVSSVSGRIATAGTSPYAVAKYGVEAWNDVMRRELVPFGVTVHLLEPGVFKGTNLLSTKAHDDRVNSVWNKMPTHLKEEYGEEYKKEVVDRWNTTLNRLGASNIDYVVNNYYHALTAYFPRLRYQCGWDAILMWSPASYLFTPVQDAFINLLVRGTVPVPAIIKNGGFK